MSVKLIGTTSGVEQDVDATSKAARVTLYDSAGNEIAPNPSGSYIAQVDLRPGAITAGAAVALWAMRNLGAKTAYLKNLQLFGSVNATTAVASSWYYALARFSAATPTGGNSIAVVKKKNSDGNTSVTDVRQIAAAATSGLTTTGITFESSLSVLTGPRSNGALVSYNYDFTQSGRVNGGFKLAANEGFAILLPSAASIAGDFLTGSIEWEEQ